MWFWESKEGQTIQTDSNLVWITSKVFSSVGESSSDIGDDFSQLQQLRTASGLLQALLTFTAPPSSLHLPLRRTHEVGLLQTQS